VRFVTSLTDPAVSGAPNAYPLGMRLVAATAAALFVSGIALAGTASEPVIIDARGVKQEPRLIRLLGPASYQPKFTRLGPWRNWGADRTRTHGRSRLNTCDPDCGAGNFKRVRVKVILSRLRASCGGYRAYHRLTFKARKPSIQDGPLDFDCRGELTYG
jgi:hypothetical protein